MKLKILLNSYLLFSCKKEVIPDPESVVLLSPEMEIPALQL